MFCPKCGTKAIEDADFCQKCGTKLIKENEIKAPAASSEPVVPVAHTQQSSASIYDVELTVSCAKFRGVFPGTVLPLLVDDVPVGELPNNGAFTCKITPGPHRIKVGRIVIGINIPEGEATVALNLQHGKFVCSSNNIVTEPSSIEPLTFRTMLKDLNAVSITGLVFIALSIIGFIVGCMVQTAYPVPDYAIAMTLGCALTIMVGALVLAAAGAVFLILSPKTRKAKAKRIVLGLVSAIAVGAIIVIVSSAVSFFNWNRMVYVNVVKNTRPFDTAENNRYWRSLSDAVYFFSPSYDDVFNRYIDSIEWITVNRDRGWVDITGRLKATDEQITVHFDAHFVAPYEIVLAGTSFTGDEEISSFLYSMFDAYVKGEDYVPGSLELLQASDDIESAEFLLCGIPLDEVIGMHSSDVAANFGEFDDWVNDCMLYGVHDYEESTLFDDGWIEFNMNGYSVDSFSSDPINLTLDGQSLVQGFDALVTILGDDYIIQGENEYSWWIAWYYDGYEISFEFPLDTADLDPDIPILVSVSPVT